MKQSRTQDLHIPRWARPIGGALAIFLIGGAVRGLYDGRFPGAEPILGVAAAVLMLGGIWLFGQIAISGTYPNWFIRAYDFLEAVSNKSNNP